MAPDNPHVWRAIRARYRVASGRKRSVIASLESYLTLPALIAGAIAASLNIYAVTGGADFGGGAWDLFASGPRKQEQRALVAEAIGPIWEANHVWLILVVVLLFTAFPPVFAR